MLAGTIDPDYQEETVLPLHDRDMEEYVCNAGDPVRRLLVLPFLEIKVSRRQQQPNPGRTTNGPDPSGMKVCITSVCKEPQPAEVFTEGKGNIVWVVEEGSYKYQL